jgi:hypothetical protein
MELIVIISGRCQFLPAGCSGSGLQGNGVWYRAEPESMTVHRRIRHRPLRGRLEIQRDHALHRDSPSIQGIRLEVPLLYGIERGAGKHQ